MQPDPQFRTPMKRNRLVVHPVQVRIIGMVFGFAMCETEVAVQIACRYGKGESHFEKGVIQVPGEPVFTGWGSRNVL